MDYENVIKIKSLFILIKNTKLDGLYRLNAHKAPLLDFQNELMSNQIGCNKCFINSLWHGSIISSEVDPLSGIFRSFQDVLPENQ